MSVSLRPSDSGRLALACRVALADDGLAAWREAVASIIDWNRMLRAAHAERVVPLLAYALTRSGLDGSPAIPPGVRDALRHAYLAGAGRAAILGDAAATLLTAFARAGIPVIVLKGLALAETVYPNPALRLMEDLDLLVRSGDVAAAARLLTQAGYTEAWHGYPDFQRADGLVDVDLHTALLHEGEIPTRLDAQPIEIETVWAAAQPATLAGAPGLVLSAPHQLLHLCQHLCLHHALCGLLRHADILALATRHPDLLTRDRLLPIAATRAGRRALFYALTSYEGCLGVALPLGLLDALRPADLSRLERRLVLRAQTGAIPSVARYYFTLQSLLTRRQRLRLVREMAGAWYRRRHGRPFGNSP